jgi:primase-polymerase (primpol)-like protein
VKIDDNPYKNRYPSQSEADMALLGYLVHATPSNEQVRRVFRMSGLGQRKKAHRDAYLNYTINPDRATQERTARGISYEQPPNKPRVMRTGSRTALRANGFRSTSAST